MAQETIDEYLGKGYWNKKALSDFLNQHTADMFDREAIVDSNGRYTFKELNQLVNRVALKFVGWV